MLCQWYHLCVNLASGTLSTRLHRNVPACRECADRVRRHFPEDVKFEEDPSGTPTTERTFDQENRSSDLLRPETS